MLAIRIGQIRLAPAAAGVLVSLVLLLGVSCGFAQETGPPVEREAVNAAESIVAEGSYEVLRDVIYAEPGGVKLAADIFQPAGDGPFPGVLMVHGGGWRMGSKRMVSGRAAQLAEQGYCVMAINYRLAPKHKFPAQWNDCVAALAYMVDNADDLKIDKHRLGGFGYSAGAHLVTLLGTTTKLKLGQEFEAAEQSAILLKAVVAGGTPTEFRILPADSDVLSYWLGGTRREQPQLYEAATPRIYVSQGDAPMFLFHGSEDALVPLLAATALANDLRQVGVPFEFFPIQRAGHILAYVDAAAFKAATEFLDARLKVEK